MQILERRHRRSHVAGGGGRSDSDSATAEVANKTAEHEVTDTASRSLLSTSVCHFSERDRRDRSIARCPPDQYAAKSRKTLFAAENVPEVD